MMPLSDVWGEAELEAPQTQSSPLLPHARRRGRKSHAMPQVEILHRRLKRCQAQARRTANLLASSTSYTHQVSEQAFGRQSATRYAHAHRFVSRTSSFEGAVEGEAGGLRVVRDIDRAKQLAKLRFAGAANHLLAQERAIARFLEEGSAHVVQVVIMDDVSTWLRQQTEPIDMGGTEAGELREAEAAEAGGPEGGLSSSKRHKWTVSQMMNIIVHLFARRRNAELQHCQLTSPGIVLPQANWSTMYDRLLGWMVWSAREGIGAEKLSPSPEERAKLQDLVKRIPRRCTIFTKDALRTNLCIVGAEQAALRRASDAGNQKMHLLLSVTCAHHQAALAKKPALLSLPGLCSALVRLCRLLQGDALCRRFKQAARLIVSKSFKRICCMALPQASGKWLARNRFYLNNAQADLPEGVGMKIADFWNNDHDSHEWVHWCLPGCCPNDNASLELSLNSECCLI